MADIAELGFVADSSQLKAANDELNKLPGSAAKAEKGVDKLNDEFSRGERATMRFYNSLERLSYKIGQSIGSELRRAAAGFATVFAISGVVMKLTQTANALDDVSKAARATGSAVESMQALSVAGELAGVGVDALASATKRNNRVLGAAIAAGKGNEGVFKRLGISARELAAMPIDVRFATIADRMKELNFSATDVTATLAALGDRGAALIGLLGEGGDQIRKAAGDVDRFHLAISDLQGANIEDMNDNFTRLGYAVQGAFNQFIATIAPAASAVFLAMANAIAAVVGNIDKITPVAQIAGAAMLTAFGPTILGAIWSLVSAIAINLVGAIRMIGVAIASNPLGALAVAIVTIITAVWTFRDAIKEAIGVDVVQIAKDAGNWIIRTFLESFEHIKMIWSNFPAVMGNFVIGAVNAVISGVNSMIAASMDGVFKLLSLLASVPGIGSGAAAAAGALIAGGTPKIAELDNPFASQIDAANAVSQANIAIIHQTDYVGNLTTAWNNLTTATDTSTISTEAAAGATDDLGTALGDVASGAAKTAADEIQKVTDKVQELKDTLMDTVGQAFKSFFMDIMHGKSALDALNNSLGNLADKLMDMVLNQAIMGIIGSLFGGGNLMGIPGIGSSNPLIGGWQIGSANGNAFTRNGIVNTPTTFRMANGGVGLMGEKGPEAVMPLERGRNGKLGISAPANQNGGGMIVIQPIIHNNAANDVDVTTKQGDDGQFEITIDKMIASKISKPGSRAHKAIKSTFGLKQATGGR